MLREAVRTALRAAFAALAAAVSIATALAALNGRSTLPFVPLLAAQLWLLATILFAAPLTIYAVVIAWRRRRSATWAEAWALVASALFAAVWFGRLKPAHQFFAAKRHLSAVGSTELLLIGVAASAIYTAGSRPARRKRAQVMRLAATIAFCSALLAVFARAIEPRPRRAVVVSPPGPGPTHASNAAARPRVLVLAIDGLDWVPLEYLGQRGQVPTLWRIVEHGRSYQLETGGLSVSPPIWTAIYTGSASGRNMVGGYTQWRFAGLPHPIWFFPEFGGHPLLMLDTLLDRTQGLGLWHGEPTSTRNIQDPTIWEIASVEGRRVGVFDPTPFPASGEIVNGRFTWRQSDRYIVEDGDGAVSHPRQIRAEMPTMYADSSEILSTERARARAALETIGPDQDLAIYYTSVLDWLGHRYWDAVAAMGDSFDRTPVADGYRLVDEVASTMIARFGPRAAVVLISDHGWEFSEYEHFGGPDGVLVVSGTGPTGYGGTAHVLDVAPTVLSLLQLPTATTMRAALADVAPPRPARRYAKTHGRRFVDVERPRDGDRSDLLRTLGYVAR